MLSQVTPVALLMVAVGLSGLQPASAGLDCNGHVYLPVTYEDSFLIKLLGRGQETRGIGTRLSSLEKHLVSRDCPWSLVEEIAEIVSYRDAIRLAALRKKELADIDKVLEAHRISQAPTCTVEEFEMFNSLDKLFDRRPLQFDNMYQHCRRHIEHTVHYIIFYYLKNCAPTHRTMVLEAANGVDEFARKTSLSLAGIRAIQGFAYNDPSVNYAKVISSIRHSTAYNNFLDLRGIVASIKSLANPEEIPADPRAMTLDAVKNLARKYVIDGCKHFVSNTDAVLNIVLYRHRLSSLEPKEYNDLSEIIASHGLCRIVIKREADLADLLFSKWTSS